MELGVIHSLSAVVGRKALLSSGVTLKKHKKDQNGRLNDGMGRMRSKGGEARREKVN